MSGLWLSELGSPAPAVSGRLVSDVYRCDLSEGQQRILLNLASHADGDTRMCYPGKRLIAWETGCTERHVARILSELVKLGAITTEQRQGGRGHRTQYTLHLEAVSVKGDIGSTKGDTQSTVSPQQRVTPETQRVTPMSVKGDIGDTPILMEPSGTVIEPSENGAEPVQGSLTDQGLPEWYTTLVTMSDQVPPYGTCRRYVDTKEATDAQCEKVADAMQSKLGYDPKKKVWITMVGGRNVSYKQIWATFKNWLSRELSPQPQQQGNYQGYSRPTRAQIPDRDAFKGRTHF